MKNKELLKFKDEIIRILEIKNDKVLIVNCNRKTVPVWVNKDLLTNCVPTEEYEYPDINDLEPNNRKIAFNRFTLISRILPFIGDKKLRCSVINQISEDDNISKQTINNYLWLYLSSQNISALAPIQKETEKELNGDQKNFRWALNKFFYTKNGNSLNMAYTLMLKERYCNNGKLLSNYPSFNQFRYFYRKHKDIKRFYISRDGLKNYQRNNRPLLGNGIQEFAPTIGTGMLDATICDIYLVNDNGEVIGRPILTACVDAYSGLCCGYSLTLEGGVYSLRNLMLNVITDKTEHCSKFGIQMNKENWNCNKLPAVLITDMGKEYVSDTFCQIADLGVTVINLPPYRPELKGAVEKFFDIIQNLYKPYLKGKGVIEPDFQERGSHDYRKDARLTLTDFEKIILHCIIYYNSQRVIENFPYTEDMLQKNVKPHSSDIWNYGLEQTGANLIPIDIKKLILTLLPRTVGKFTRKGLIVNKLRYKNKNYTEQYLKGGNVTVAYNPEDVSQIWAIENGYYIPFELIERRFDGREISMVEEIKTAQQAVLKSTEDENIQAKIDLAQHIEIIANSINRGNIEIKNIRNNRKLEQNKKHIDYIKEV